MERIIGRKPVQDLEKRNILPPNQGWYRTGKATWENPARFTYNVLEGFQRKEKTLAVTVDLEDAYNRAQFILRMELPVQYGVGLTLKKWRAVALEETGCHATWKLELYTPTMDKRTSTMHLSPCPQSSTMSTQRDWQVCWSWLLTLADNELIDKTSNDTHAAVIAVQKKKKCHNGAKRLVWNQYKQGTSPVVHPQQQSNKTGNARGLIKWSHKTQEHPQVSWDPLQQNAHIQEASWINKTWTQKCTVCTRSHGCKGIKQRCLFLL